MAKGKLPGGATATDMKWIANRGADLRKAGKSRSVALKQAWREFKERK